MKKCAVMITVFLATALTAFAQAKPPEVSRNGFMVFSGGKIHNYVLGADKKYTLKAVAKAGEDFEDYAACDGTLFWVNAILGIIIRLDGDLKEAGRITLKPTGDIARMPGSDGKYLSRPCGR